ncbi:MAG: hypothetical protein FWF28_10760, partial [Micrococcales bacterium]|nr:hypothetical protein [Micrococcales bacterium]
MSFAAWIAIAVAGLVSLIAPALFSPVLRRAGVVDIPNERSSHVKPTLRGGGIGPLAGYVTGMTIVVIWGNAGNHVCPMLVIGAGAVLMALLGLNDDLRGGSGVLLRAAAQMVVAIGVATTLGVMGGATWWQVVVAVFAYAWYV